MRSIPQHCTLQYKKKFEIRVEPDLFRMVNAPGLSSSLVGGGGGAGKQFSRLLLKTDHINTYILVEVSGRFPRVGYSSET